LTSKESDINMKNQSILLAAVAPLTMIWAGIASSVPVLAAETAGPRPIPKIRTPTKPAEIEKVPRIPKQLPGPVEGSVKVEEAEVAPTKPKRIRVVVPENSGAETDSIPRNRQNETPSVEAEESAESDSPGRVRIGIPPVGRSTSAEIESTPRIRTRTTRATEGETDVEQAPPTRSRIGKTIQDRTTSPKERRSTPARTISSAQTICLFRPGRNPAKASPAPSTESVNILFMVCKVKGQAALMSFLYDFPADKNASNALSLAMKNHEAGATSVIEYEREPAQTDSNGKPLYQIVSIKTGEQSRRQALCIDANGGFLPTTPEDGDGPVVQKWCSDGSAVFPVSFRVNRWLKAKIAPSISMADPNDQRRSYNITSVVFDDAIAADASGAVLIRSTEPQLVPPGFDCKLSSRDVGSLYCQSDPIPTNGDTYKTTQTTFLAFSLPEVRLGVASLGQDRCEEVVGSPYYDGPFKNVPYSPGVSEATRYYDYKKRTCTKFRIAYRLLPGIVAKEHRSLVGGACRLAVSAVVKEDTDVTETWSRKSLLTKENIAVMERPLGESRGAAMDIIKVNAPCP
jgi:hypothetical protein